MGHTLKGSAAFAAEKSHRDIAYEVMTLVDICVDMILTGNVRPRFHQVEQMVGDLSLQLGGSSSIFAAQIAKLGTRTAALGWLGADAFGDFALSELDKTGVDVSRVKRHATMRTGVGVALSEPEDRAILTYMGTLDAPNSSDLDPSLLGLIAHWHIGAYFLLRGLQPHWPEWLRLCRTAGITTSLDPNWDPNECWTGIIEILPFIDVFLPNEAEALAISRQINIQDAARSLSQYGPLVVIKCGERGAIAARGNKLWELDASKSTVVPAHIADTTGAGDNFDAGFLHGWLAEWDVNPCLELGHRCAVSSLEHPGGIHGQLVIPAGAVGCSGKARLK